MQLAFPCTKEFNNDNNANSIHFAFAIYLLNTSGGKGRISTETPQTKQKDAGATQITLLTGILRPLLLRSTYYRSDNPYAREGRVSSQLSLPLFPRTDAQLAEAITLPVLDMEHSFYMLISALPGLFSRLVQVPLYRQPNTLGWAGLDSQLPNFTRSAEETIDFSPLSGLPHFLPSAVKPLIQHYLFDDQLRYDPACFGYLQSNHFLPGTSSEAMNHTYVWDLSWTISFDAPGIKEALELLSHSHPGLCHLFRALGPHFHRSLIHALVAPNGHFPALLNATLWGLRSGHTSLCVQGIFGSGKTYSSSLLLILVTSVLGLRTVLSADPNLPLATAAENISDLLRDAHQNIRSQYARCLAQNIPKLPILTFSPSTAPHSSNPIPFSAAYWLPKGLSFVTPRPLIRSSPLFLSFAFSLSMMRHSKADNPDLPSSLHFSLAFASRSSPAIVNKLVQGPGGTFSKKNCSSDYHTKTLASLVNPIRFSRMNSPPVSVLLFPIILMHRILPHSLGCPADAYFTQVVSHYPHLYIGNLTLGSCDTDISKIPSPLFPLSAYLSICKARHTTSQDTASSLVPCYHSKCPH